MNLEQSLRELARDDAAAQVPARVDAVVMAAWDAAARHGSEGTATGSRPWLVWAGAAFAAASIVALIVVPRDQAVEVAPHRLESLRERHPPTVAAPEAVEPASEPIALRGTALEGTAQPSRPARARQRAMAAPLSPPPADTGYVLVPDAGTGAMPLTLMRVRMPRSAFSRLVPIANPDGDGLVDVEVLVGEDGVARSIRRAAAVGWADAN